MNWKAFGWKVLEVLAMLLIAAVFGALIVIAYIVYMSSQR